MSNAKHIERIGLPSLARRSGRTCLYNQGRVSANVISLRMPCVTDMQMARKKQIGAALSEPRHSHLCSTYQIALVVTLRQIKWMVSHDHLNDFVRQRAKLFTQTTNLDCVDASTLKDQ